MMILDSSLSEFGCPPADAKTVRHFKSIANEKQKWREAWSE